MVIRRIMRSNTKEARILGLQVGPPLPAADVPAACPLCGRALIPGPSTDEHHLTPRSLGGKEKFLVHKICHQKIHRTIAEKSGAALQQLAGTGGASRDSCLYQLGEKAPAGIHALTP